MVEEGDGCGYKGATRGCLVWTRGSILIVVMVTQGYTCDEIPCTHTHIHIHKYRYK